MPSHVAIGKIGVWNHCLNVGLPIQEKRRKRKKVQTALWYLWAPPKCRQAHKNLWDIYNPPRTQSTKHDICKTPRRLWPCSAISETMHRHDLDISTMYCMWGLILWLTWPGAYFADGVSHSVGTFYFLFLFNVETGVSQDCLLETTACFVLSFFCPCFQLMLVVKGWLEYLSSESEPMEFLSVAEAFAVPGRQEGGKKKGKQWIPISSSWEFLN